MPATKPAKPTIGDLKVAYDLARRDYHAALIEAFPFKVGDVVRNSNGQEAHVCDVAIRIASNDSYYEVHATAALRNRDGTFSGDRAELTLSEWRNAEKIGSRPWTTDDDQEVATRTKARNQERWRASTAIGMARGGADELPLELPLDDRTARKPRKRR